MKVTKATIVVGVLLYVFLLILAFNGATILLEPLLIPLILVVMVAGGNWLSHYMGMPGRSQKFRDRDNKPES
jgi:hypothetical protein